MRLYRIVPILAVVVLFSACTQAGIKYQDLYSSGKNYVRLAVENDKEGAPVAKGYDHPQKLTEAQVRRVLEDVRFQEYAFFSWRKEKPLFVEAEVARLAPHLVAAFDQATPNQWVDFAVTARKRDYLLPTPRITDGWMFFTDGRLNIVLKNLNFELVDYDERALGNPEKIFTVGSYRLVDDAEQHSKPAVVKGDSIFKWEHTNWLIVDMAHYAAVEDEAVAAPVPVDEPADVPADESAPVEGITPPSEAPAPSAVPEKPSGSERSIKQRLQELQELFDAGLITRQEFDAKKQELLDQL